MFTKEIRIIKSMDRLLKAMVNKGKLFFFIVESKINPEILITLYKNHYS